MIIAPQLVGKRIQKVEMTEKGNTFRIHTKDFVLVIGAGDSMSVVSWVLKSRDTKPEPIVIPAK